ncbi:isoprenoid synthase domain-containing protein, partial [Mycena capillaripes]
VLELPDIHVKWPFTVAYNKWEDSISQESLAWIESLSILSASEMRKFRKAHFDVFASMTYAYFTDAQHYRLACDLVYLLFVLDDLTDELSAQDAQTITAISLDGLRCSVKMIDLCHAEPPHSFSERLHHLVNAEVLDRFMDNYEMYLKSVVDEAADREQKTIRSSLDSYLTMRRETGAVKCCFDLFLIPHHIPSDILADHRIRRVETLGHDLVCVGNDILSFNAEQARGDIHNAVIVVMHERGLSIQDAMDFVGGWYQEAVEEFYTVMRDLPPCGSVTVRNGVKMYVAAIANFVTSNYEWSLLSGRYFSPGEELKEG